MCYDQTKRKTCVAVQWVISILVILCVVSAVASILLGVLIAKPGIQALDFKAATCKVKFRRKLDDVSCDCSGFYSEDTTCSSKFPCFQVTVAYEPRRLVIRHNETKDFFKNEALLHETETAFGSKFFQCSFHLCRQDYKMNKLSADNFRAKYGQVGDVYPCLYNPKHSGQVIAFRRYNKNHILVALIIPPATFFVCLVTLIILCVAKAWTAKTKKARRPVYNPFAAPRRYLGRDMPAFEPDEVVDSANKPPNPINMFSSETGERKRGSVNSGTGDIQDQQDLGDEEKKLSDVVPQNAQMSTAM